MSHIDLQLCTEWPWNDQNTYFCHWAQWCKWQGRDSVITSLIDAKQTSHLEGIVTAESRLHCRDGRHWSHRQMWLYLQWNTPYSAVFSAVFVKAVTSNRKNTGNVVAWEPCPIASKFVPMFLRCELWVIMYCTLSRKQSCNYPAATVL